jgi:ABC-type nitrate/sulfonate/bicarbonate transport system permease component
VASASDEVAPLSAIEDPRKSRTDARIRWASLAGFFVVWQVAAMVLASRFLPTPLAVGEVLAKYVADGEIFYDVGITLARVAASFVIAMVVGVAIGILMGRSRRIDALLDGWLLVFLNVPALVVAVLCYLWFGLTELAAVVAVSINKIPTVVVIMREGARAVQPELLQVARAYRLHPMTTLRRVYLPQLYPSAFASARSGLALIWKIVLLVELIGRSNGVGFQIAVFFQFFDIKSILAYSFAFMLVIFAVEVLILKPIERRVTAWRLS